MVQPLHGFGSRCFFAHCGLRPTAPAGAILEREPAAAAVRAGGGAEDAAQDGTLGKAGPHAPPACALRTAEDVPFEGAFEEAGPIKPRGALTLWVGGRRPECLLLASDAAAGSAAYGNVMPRMVTVRAPLASQSFSMKVPVSTSGVASASTLTLPPNPPGAVDSDGQSVTIFSSTPFFP